MNIKRRWLSALLLDDIDRLPFWPKLDNAYPRAQEHPFNKMTLHEIHNWIGSDEQIYLPTCLKIVLKNSFCSTTQLGNQRKTEFITRYGTTELISQFDEESQSWHPIKMPITSLEDLKLMIEFYSDIQLDVDDAVFNESRVLYRQTGNAAFFAERIGKSPFLGESPLMNWVENLAGVEKGHLLLFDFKDEVEELFNIMHALLLKGTEIIIDCSTADILYLGENTSTTLISPDQFKKYCHHVICEYGHLVEESDRLLYLHMCGHLKALLPDLANLPVAAFESFSSPPVGNTRLIDGRGTCPDKCLVGGTNATLWTKSYDEIVSELENDLGRLPHHRGIIVTSGGVMPPICKPETIKKVCEYVHSYEITN